MKLAGWCAILAAFGSSAHAGGGMARKLAVYEEFENPASNAMHAWVEQELAAIFAPLGTRVEWRSMRVRNGNEAFDAVAVVTFLGTCDLSGPAPEFSEPAALGWTRVADGEVLPFSSVDCDRIHAFVRPALLALSESRRIESLGRAIGRVLAHELYHVLSHTQHHGMSGVAKPAYRVPDLIGGDFSFARSDLRLLADRMAGGR